MGLNFHVQGEGAPLIILHGFLGASDNWRAMGKRLASHFKVYCVDLRNHGASPHNQIMTYPAMAEDLSEFYASEKIPHAHLLGHSMGGKVALQFALQRPRAVDKLVIADIAPKAYPPTHRPLLNALTALELNSCATYADADRALAGEIADAALRQFLVKNLARGADNKFHWRIGLTAIVDNYDELTKAVEIGRSVATPTCFLRGGRSSFITDADLPAIAEKFSQVEFVTLAGAGHWLHIDAPDDFFHAVTRFLTAASS